jgi:hypothetical protein
MLKKWKKNAYIRVGRFTTTQFIIQDQQKGYGNYIQAKVGFGCRRQQRAFISLLAQITLSLLPKPSVASEPPLSETDLGMSSAAFCLRINNQHADDKCMGENFKLLLQIQFFVASVRMVKTALWCGN